MSNNHGVGYRKPPKNSQFKPGQSGNKKGRPKGKQKEGLLDLLNKELESKLTLKDGSKITKAEAAVRQLCNKASGGDFKSGKLILDITAKQQVNTLASEFLNKLIKENYLTEKNIKDYLNSGKILDTNSMPAAIYNLCKGSVEKHARAQISVIDVLFLANIWQMFSRTIHLDGVLKTISEEYNFWEGFDTAMEAVSIGQAEYDILAAEAGKTREYKRPDDPLYDTAVKMYLYMMLGTRSSFLNIRDVCMGVAGYENAEKEWFGDEQQNYMRSEAKAEMTEREFNEVMTSIDEYKKEYALFNKVSNSSKEKNLNSIKEMPAAEEMNKLLEWYSQSVK